MNYMDIKKEDLNNGDGIRASLWVSGCPHHCKGCHNSVAWDYRAGKEFTEETYLELKEAVLRAGNHLSILGGEPLAPGNYDTVYAIVLRLREEIPDLNVWLWTGYIEDELIAEDRADILGELDVVIFGRFIMDQKSTKKKWRGSLNQKMWVRGMGYVD